MRVKRFILTGVGLALSLGGLVAVGHGFGDVLVGIAMLDPSAFGCLVALGGGALFAAGWQVLERTDRMVA